jgi:hypothetical protein
LRKLEGIANLRKVFKFDDSGRFPHLRQRILTLSAFAQQGSSGRKTTADPFLLQQHISRPIQPLETYGKIKHSGIPQGNSGNIVEDKTFLSEADELFATTWLLEPPFSDDAHLFANKILKHYGALLISPFLYFLSL